MKKLLSLALVLGNVLTFANSTWAFSLLDAAKNPAIVKLENQLTNEDYSLSQIRDLKARGGSAVMEKLYQIEFVDLTGNGRSDRKFIAHWEYVNGNWAKKPDITEQDGSGN